MDLGQECSVWEEVRIREARREVCQDRKRVPCINANNAMY
jgi:hypothetical protein